MYSEKNEDFNKLLNHAYFFLKFRPRTRKETENYLYKKIQKHYWSRDDVTKVIKHLEELDLIDDRNFVKWFVEQRTLLKPKSAFVLKQELLKHGVDKEMIEVYFSEHSLNEEALAEKTLKEKWYRYNKLDRRKRFEKARSFLLRRGFGYDICKKIINMLENNN
ncbi:RecX family transcriptional regulator [Candidatus Roizmanbacteria bacterium]|nr:RecX family transcriptional regulator [Candidatus Roizmanbacteria bacterium]